MEPKYHPYMGVPPTGYLPGVRWVNMPSAPQYRYPISEQFGVPLRSQAFPVPPPPPDSEPVTDRTKKVSSESDKDHTKSPEDTAAQLLQEMSSKLASPAKMPVSVWYPGHPSNPAVSIPYTGIHPSALPGYWQPPQSSPMMAPVSQPQTPPIPYPMSPSQAPTPTHVESPPIHPLPSYLTLEKEGAGSSWREHIIKRSKRRRTPAEEADVSSADIAVARAGLDPNRTGIKNQTRPVPSGNNSVKLRFNTKATNILTNWFEANLHDPYPSQAVKSRLAEQCGMTLTQIGYWFGNKRVRWKRSLDRKMAKQSKKQSMHHSMSEGNVTSWEGPGLVPGQMARSSTEDHDADVEPSVDHSYVRQPSFSVDSATTLAITESVDDSSLCLDQDEQE